MSESLPIRRRPRRLRASAAIRDLIRETCVNPSHLIAPLFLKAQGPPEPVASMPGVFRRNPQDLLQHCRELAALGIRGAAIFPCIDAALKDADGSEALNPNGLLQTTVASLKADLPDFLLFTDVALDPYTTHGHDGVLDPSGRDVDNDRTVRILARMAVVQANAGVDFVAPSDMMDGRVRAIRDALDASGRQRTGILAYSVKFASAYYGPFRDAVGSMTAAGTPHLDKRTYQMDPANPREAMLEARLDEEEGADILMVKPAGPYLDIIFALRRQTVLPIAAYQVSGEFAQIHAAAKLGWLDCRRTRDESLLAIRRAGADIILTYFAEEIARDRQA